MYVIFVIIINKLILSRQFSVVLSFKTDDIHVLCVIIICLSLTRNGNYKIHEFDWLKSILTAV